MVRRKSVVLRYILAGIIFAILFGGGYSLYNFGSNHDSSIIMISGILVMCLGFIIPGIYLCSVFFGKPSKHSQHKVTFSPFPTPDESEQSDEAIYLVNKEEEEEELTDEELDELDRIESEN